MRAGLATRPSTCADATEGLVRGMNRLDQKNVGDHVVDCRDRMDGDLAVFDVALEVTVLDFDVLSSL